MSSKGSFSIRLPPQNRLLSPDLDTWSGHLTFLAADISTCL